MKKAHWKTIKTFIDQQHPDFKKEGIEMITAIEEFKEESLGRQLKYKEHFKYIPSEALMQILVLKAALEYGD